MRELGVLGRLTDAQRAEKLHRAIGLAQAIARDHSARASVDGVRRVAAVVVDLLEAVAGSLVASREAEGLRVEVVPAGEITKGDDVLITGALGAVRKTVFSTMSSEEDGCALVFTDADSFVLPGVDYTVARVVAAAPVASRGIEDACVCGHTARWHSHGGEGGCEHDGECKCRGFTFPAEVHLACGRSFADHSPDGDCPVASREGEGLEGEAREFVVCANCPNPSFASESIACRVCRAGTDAWSEGLRRVRSRESEQGA